MRNTSIEKQVWELDVDLDNQVTIKSAGMTVLTHKKGYTSAGFLPKDNLENFKLISTAPEMFDLVLRAFHILNEDIEPKLKEAFIREFNEDYRRVRNKIWGNGEIKKPNYKFHYQWEESDWEKYHESVKSLKYKI